MLPVIHQGADVYKGIRIRDEEGALINLDSLVNVLFYFYTDKEAKLKYSRETKYGYYSINKVSSTYYDIWIDSSITKDLALGVLTMEIKIVKTQADLVDGKEDLICVTEIGEVRPCEMKDDDGLKKVTVQGDYPMVISGDASTQILDLSIIGITTENTDNLRLYWNLNVYDESSEFILYKNSSKSINFIVAKADIYAGSLEGGVHTATISGTLYNSGLSGSVTIDLVISDTDSGNTIDFYSIPQISNLTLNGVTFSNSDNYKLYWNITYLGGNYKLDLYKDVAKTNLMASGSTTVNGQAFSITGNGITGSAIINYVGDDTDSGNIITIL